MYQFSITHTLAKPVSKQVCWQRSWKCVSISEVWTVKPVLKQVDLVFTSWKTCFVNQLQNIKLDENLFSSKHFSKQRDWQVYSKCLGGWIVIHSPCSNINKPGCRQDSQDLRVYVCDLTHPEPVNPSSAVLCINVLSGKTAKWENQQRAVLNENFKKSSKFQMELYWLKFPTGCPWYLYI